MTTSLALTGWLVALCTVVVGRRAGARRMERIARSCHELRGPITAARLGLEWGERFGELSRGRLRAVELELDRAALALEDLAGVGRAHSSSRMLEIVSATEIVEQATEAWQATARASGVRLYGESATATSVRCDRLRIAQAIGNLIANAIEHGGGDVELTGRTDADAVRLEVLDGGPGLPAPISQLTRRARGGRGARGRGLAIAAAIAAEHGGRLSAAPSRRGARLVLELPVSASAVAVALPGGGPEAGALPGAGVEPEREG